MPTADSMPSNISDLSLDQAVILLADQQKLLTSQQQSIDALQHQLDWFKRQLFGEKSERRLVENPSQLHLSLEDKEKNSIVVEPELETVTYQRGKAKKKRADDCVNDSGLRFGPDVPMKPLFYQRRGWTLKPVNRWT